MRRFVRVLLLMASIPLLSSCQWWRVSTITTPCTEDPPPIIPGDDMPPGPIVIIPLRIVSFSADANPVGKGDSSTLRWVVSGPVRKLTLEGVTASAKDVTGRTSEVVTPSATKKYKLIARSRCSVKQAEIVVTVSELMTLDPTRVAPGRKLDVYGTNIPSDATIHLTHAGTTTPLTPPLTPDPTLLMPRRVIIPKSTPAAKDVEVRAVAGALRTNALKLEISRRLDGDFTDVMSKVGTTNATCGSRTLTFTKVSASTWTATFSGSGGTSATIRRGSIGGAAFSPSCTTAVIVTQPDAAKPNDFTIFLSRFDGLPPSAPPPASVKTLDGLTPAVERIHLLFSPDDSIAIITGFGGSDNYIAPRDMTRGGFFDRLAFTTPFKDVKARIVDGVTIRLDVDGTISDIPVEDP